MELGELTKAKSMEPASSEATKIEQTRAFGEVVVQAELAKRFPREMDTVFKRIDEAFELSPALIAASKFNFPKGGKDVIGYTIQFARAVASCVGNIHYSVKELSMSDDRTEMLVYAWDLETNAMQTRSFIVRHRRYGASNPKELKNERDIYENNANVGGRRVRECILGVLPASAVKYAEKRVEELLQRAFPPEKQKAYALKNIERFEGIGVTREMIIKNRGNRPPETWTKNDLAALSNYWDTIEKGISSKEEIFSPDSQPAEEQSGGLAEKLKNANGNQKADEDPTVVSHEIVEEDQPGAEEPAPKEWAENLALIVNDPGYRPAIQSLLKNEEISPQSLRTKDEQRAKIVYDNIVKTKGFLDAEKPTQSEDEEFFGVDHG